MIEDNSTFQMSIIELFIVILFITISFAYFEILGKEKVIQDGKENASKYKQAIQEKEEELSTLHSQINILRDSLQLVYSDRMAEGNKAKSNDEGVGSGIGPCWKNQDGSSISMFSITYFDSSFHVRSAWPFEYRKTARRILPDKLFKDLSVHDHIVLMSKNFVDTLRVIRERGQFNSPPCYYIAEIRDSTTTKKAFLRQDFIASQIFLLNRKYLYK